MGVTKCVDESEGQLWDYDEVGALQLHGNPLFLPSEWVAGSCVRLIALSNRLHDRMVRVLRVLTSSFATRAGVLGGRYPCLCAAKQARRAGVLRGWRACVSVCSSLRKPRRLTPRTEVT